jgi:hypothetical protein
VKLHLNQKARCGNTYLWSQLHRRHRKEDHGMGQPQEKVRPYLKNSYSKKGWDVVQVIKHPPSKPKAELKLQYQNPYILSTSTSPNKCQLLYVQKHSLSFLATIYGLSDLPAQSCFGKPVCIFNCSILGEVSQTTIYFSNVNYSIRTEILKNNFNTSSFSFLCKNGYNNSIYLIGIV